MILIVVKEPMMIEGPLERRYQEGSGRPPDGGNNQDRGYFRRGKPPDRSGDPLLMDDPLIMEDPLLMGDPLMMEDPLMIEDPLEMDDILCTLEDKDHWTHQDPLDQ